MKPGDKVRQYEGRHVGTVERMYLKDGAVRVRVRWDDNNHLEYFDQNELEVVSSKERNKS